MYYEYIIIPDNDTTSFCVTALETMVEQVRQPDDGHEHHRWLVFLTTVRVYDCEVEIYGVECW